MRRIRQPTVADREYYARLAAARYAAETLPDLLEPDVLCPPAMRAVLARVRASRPAP